MSFSYIILQTLGVEAYVEMITGIRMESYIADSMVQCFTYGAQGHKLRDVRKIKTPHA